MIYSKISFLGIASVMVTVVGNGYVEFKSWTKLFTHRANTLGKSMNPTILPPAMGK